MNKRNLIIQAAVAGLFSAATLSAYATGTGSTNGNTAQIATQAVTNSTNIGTGSIQYVETAAVPPGSYYVYVKLNQGATFAAGAGKSTEASTTTTGPLRVAQNGSADSTVSVGAGVVSADATFVAFPITVTESLPANAETFTFKPVFTDGTAGGTITGALAAAGTGSLTATMSIGSSASYSTTLTTPAVDEGTAATSPIVNFVSGISANALQSGAAGFTAAPYSGVVETDVIDVVNQSGLALVRGGTTSNTGNGIVLNLGGFYFLDASPNALGADAATAFNIATDYTVATSTAVVSAPAGFFNVIGSTGSVFLTTDVNCGSGGIDTASVSSNGATATFSAIPAFTTDVARFVCVTGQTKTAWVTGTPAITATLMANTSTTANVTLASANLYTLGTNGSSVYVREYVPAAAQASTGYTSYVRVINTGSVAATPSFAFIDDATGTVGNAGKGASIPAGGALTLSSSAIEGLSGITAPSSASARPRVLVTAPTTITVQSYLYNQSANVFTEVSGGSNGGTGVGLPFTPQTGQ